MKSVSLMLALLHTVLCIQLQPTEETEKVDLSYKTEIVEKKWYWGNADVITPKVKSQIEEVKNVTMSPIELYDPCAEYRPVIPDYSASGQRISEVKCSELIWEIKQKEEKETRRIQCTIKRYKDRTDHPSTIGGRNADPGEFPHMGAIGWKAVENGYIFKCGSTIISSKFVLTAAHCSKASITDSTLADPEPKIVRLSRNNIIVFTFKNGSTTQDVNILRIIVHPEYKSPKKYNDIALMELEREVGFNDLVRPACLWTKNDVSEFKSHAIVTGWGVLKSGSLDISPDLQAADVDIIETQLCKDLLGSSCNRQWCGVMDHQLCAGKLAGGVDACQGDSGGPLQVKLSTGETLTDKVYYVIGVTSFGVGCALPNLPGIYTRVASFVDWIEENVWKN